MGERGGTDKERLARSEAILTFISKNIERVSVNLDKVSSNQKKIEDTVNKLNVDTERRWGEHDIKGAIVEIKGLDTKINTLDTSHKNMDKRLSRVEDHIYNVKWVAGIIAFSVIGFVAKFFIVKVDADKVIPLGIIEITNIIERVA